MTAWTPETVTITVTMRAGTGEPVTWTAVVLSDVLLRYADDAPISVEASGPEIARMYFAAKIRDRLTSETEEPALCCAREIAGRLVP